MYKAGEVMKNNVFQWCQRRKVKYRRIAPLYIKSGFVLISAALSMETHFPVSRRRRLSEVKQSNCVRHYALFANINRKRLKKRDETMDTYFR